MVMTDPIADMLTRIRNANQMRHDIVNVPFSKIKEQVAEILKNEGFIKSVEVNTDGTFPVLKLQLKYSQTNQRVISGLKRISKPGLRVYVSSEEVPRVLNGMGIAIISTSQGLMTDKQARRLQIGGEVLAYVW